MDTIKYALDGVSIINKAYTLEVLIQHERGAA